MQLDHRVFRYTILIFGFSKVWQTLLLCIRKVNIVWSPISKWFRLDRSTVKLLAFIALKYCGFLYKKSMAFFYICLWHTFTEEKTIWSNVDFRFLYSMLLHHLNMDDWYLLYEYVRRLPYVRHQRRLEETLVSETTNYML